MSGTTINQSYTWLPTQIPGCQLWFDAADSSKVTLSGSKVTQWTDKSSNAYFVSQGSAAAQPTYTSNVQNGLGGIQFGSGLFLFTDGSNIPNFSSGSTASVFITARNASTNNGWNIVNTMWFDGQNIASSRYHFSFNQGVTPGTTLFASGSLTGQVTSNAVAASSNAILGFTTSPSSSSIHTNGSSNSYGGKTLTSANNNTDFMFNDARGTVFGADIIIFEMVGYSTQVTETQRQQIEGYMAWKWGLQGSLPASHPYRGNPPFMNTLSLPVTITVPIPQVNNSVFQPTQISGCSLWLDAADMSSMILSGSSITRWNDKSGNGRNFTATQGNFSPFFDGGIRVLSIPNTTYMTTSVALSVTANISWVFVVAKLGTTNDAYLLNLTPDGDEAFRYTFGGKYTGAPGAPGDLNDLCVPGQSYINGVLNTATTYTNYHQINGPIQTTRTTTSITISSPFLSRYFVGTLAEVIFYTGPITNAQRQQVEGYLAWKWGLQGSLPSTHPYKNSAFPGISYAPIPVAPPQIKSASWLPTQISGCQLWLDAGDSSSLILSGSNVTQWKDKSTNAFPFTVVPGQSSPVFERSFNGRNSTVTALNTTSTMYYQSQISATTFVNSTGITYFIVGIQTSGFLLAKFFDSVSSQARIISVEVGGGLRSDFNLTILSPGNSTTVPFLMCSRYDGASTEFTIFYNGTSVASTNVTAPSYNFSNWMALFGQYTGSAAFGAAGSISEFISYRNSLTTTQRQQVEGYLAWKWGLQGNLPGSHPYKLFPPSP